MIRIGLYGRPACAALVIVAAMAVTAGARAAWRDPKYHKADETSKEEFDAIAIDTEAPNANAIGQSFHDRGIPAFESLDLDVIAEFLGVPLPEEARALLYGSEEPSDDEGDDQEAEMSRLEAEAKAKAQADAAANTSPPVGEAVEALSYERLKELAKTADLGLGGNPAKAAIIAALLDKGITHAPVEG